MTEKHTPVAYQNKRNGFIAKEDKNPEYNSPLYSSETVEQLEAENAALRKQVEELLAFAKEYVYAWENGLAGYGFLLRIAKTAIAALKEK